MRNFIYFFLPLFLLICLVNPAIAQKNCKVNAPTNLGFTNVTPTGFTVNWNTVPGAMTYSVEISDGFTTEGPYYLSASSTSYTKSNATAATKYTVKIGASGCGGTPTADAFNYATDEIMTGPIVIEDVAILAVPATSGDEIYDPGAAYLCMQVSTGGSTTQSPNSVTVPNSSIRMLVVYTAPQTGTQYSIAFAVWSADGSIHVAPGAGTLKPYVSDFDISLSANSEEAYIDIVPLGKRLVTVKDPFTPPSNTGYGHTTVEFLDDPAVYVNYELSANTYYGTPGTMPVTCFSDGAPLVVYGGSKDQPQTYESIAERDLASFATPAADLLVMPNPFTDRLELALALPQAGAVTVSLYNALGQRVDRQAFNGLPASDDLRLELNTDALSAGMYRVVVETPTNRFTKSVLKKP